jgi:hypothetical protein
MFHNKNENDLTSEKIVAIKDHEDHKVSKKPEELGVGEEHHTDTRGKLPDHAHGSEAVRKDESL